MLSIFFPVVAYDLDDSEVKEFVAGCLGSPSQDIGDLRAAYLQRWGIHGDTNFRQVLEKLDLSLETTHS